MSQAVVAKLFDLQQLDLDIDRVLTEIEVTRRALAEDATKPARDAAARAKRQAGEARRAAREAESSVHEAEARIQKQEKRLYAGETPVRDLAALQTELAHLRTAHAMQEEQVLTLMLAAEEVEGAASQAAEALQAAEHDWEQQKAHLRTHMGTLESSLAALRAQHDAHDSPDAWGPGSRGGAGWNLPGVPGGGDLRRPPARTLGHGAGALQQLRPYSVCALVTWPHARRRGALGCAWSAGGGTLGARVVIWQHLGRRTR